MRRIFLLTTIYCLLSTLLTGCATAPSVSGIRFKETVTIGGARYVSVQSLAEAYNADYLWDPIAKKVILTKGDKEARMMVNSSRALLNDSVRTMDKEVKFYGAVVVISESFARKTLSPFFRERRPPGRVLPDDVAAFPIKTVIIDAGHGGRDPGAIGYNGLREKDVVLDIAKRLKKKLQACGINVIMTRESDRFVSLAQRSRIANANAKKVDFFISIHANASRSRWVSGIEVFYLSESIDDNLRSLKAIKNRGLNVKESFSGRNTQTIIMDLLLTEYRRESKVLARFICNALSKKLYQRNRGAKPARFYVLKSYIPAILIEAGFISNPAEEKKLRTASYRNKIAQTLVEGIIQYNRSFSQRRTARY